jgi:hypothetical protein
VWRRHLAGSPAGVSPAKVDVVTRKGSWQRGAKLFAPFALLRIDFEETGSPLLAETAFRVNPFVARDMLPGSPATPLVIFL